MSQNFTFGKSLSSLITLELVKLKTANHSDEITSVLIVDCLRKKHPEINAYIELNPAHFDYFKRRVRSTLKELSASKIVKIEKKLTKIKTHYNAYFINFEL